MKTILTILTAAAALTLFSCGGGQHGSYDPEVCDALAMKIERRDSLTQSDYGAMIVQNEHILKYLIENSERVEELPAEERYEASRELLADPEYMERFSYLFTLGSALYNADAGGKLDRKNREAYKNLDKYNERFAGITDRM